MTHTYSPERIRSAVAILCPAIWARVQEHAPQSPTEKELWQELASCVLSSQVSYDTAAIAAKQVVDSMAIDSRLSSEEIEQRIFSILSAPMMVDGRARRYRFPKSRASQLASTCTAVFEAAGSLRGLLNSFGSPATTREWLVAHAHGLGPKQASMFLRNIGVSYEFAILDRHVLNYAELIGIHLPPVHRSYRLSGYLQHEEMFREHAIEFGYRVGILDWAIWIVMRVANRLDG